LSRSRSPASGPLPPAELPEAPPPGAWHRRTFASFSLPNYRWFFFGQGTSLIGSWVRSTAQGWLVYLLTGSRLDLGTVAALGQLPLVLSPVAGAVADRMDKKRLLLVLAAFAMALSLVLAALVWTGEVRTWHVMAVAALAGLEMAFEIPVRQSYVVEMVGKRHLLNAIALNSAMFNGARMAGPAVAGLLMGFFGGGDGAGPRALRGIALCFLLDGLSFLAVIFALLRIRSTPAHRAEEGGLRARLAAGFAYVRGSRRARLLLTLLGVCTVFGWSYLALMPAFAKDVLRLDERGFGLLLSANGVGAALGALWVAGRPETEDRAVIRRRVFGSLGLFGSMVVVFSRMTHPWLAAAALALAGFGAISFVSTSNTLIQLQVPDHLRGRVMGIWALVFGGAMPIGSWLVGAAAEAWDSPAAITLSGTACLVLSGLVWLRLPPANASPAGDSERAAGRA
jgi:MFS family permease